MNPYLQAQMNALVEGIRLLEVYVTAPLGLYSDIKMMRESLDAPAAADLAREETAQRRQLHAVLTGDHPRARPESHSLPARDRRNPSRLIRRRLPRAR